MLFLVDIVVTALMLSGIRVTDGALSDDADGDEDRLFGMLRKNMTGDALGDEGNGVEDVLFESVANSKSIFKCFFIVGSCMTVILCQLWFMLFSYFR